MKNKDLPKITFGTIVLNGEPFTRYCLRAFYPFADEIIVVEGACEDAAGISTPDGHSTDGTLESLRRFKQEEDPEGKVQIVTRSGFWKEKDEQSRAYAERARGDYLWQVDIDESYQPHDMQTVLQMLREDDRISTISFRQITFWGGFDYTTNGWYLLRGADIYNRLFKWGDGYQYVTHRVPTVVDAEGRNLRDLKWVNGYALARRGVYLYHYSLVFPSQVLRKCAYYSKHWPNESSAIMEWMKHSYLRLDNPFRPHNAYSSPSWIERFRGTHPPAILQLIDDLRSHRIDVEVRRDDDVERLLQSPAYRSKRAVLKTVGCVDAWTRRMKRAATGSARRLRTASGGPRR